MTEQAEQEQKAPCVHCGRTDWRWAGECWFHDPAADPPLYRRSEIRCDWCRPLRMNAYYYSFGATGVELVDRVLSAVAMAGKGYHHTESWNDEGLEDCGPFRGGDYVSWIQNAANDAAALLRERDAQIATLTEALEEAEQDIWDWVRTARGLRERATDPDHDPLTPHLRGIVESEQVLTRIAASLHATRPKA